jgi:hypothetical protein
MRSRKIHSTRRITWTMIGLRSLRPVTGKLGFDDR